MSEHYDTELEAFTDGLMELAEDFARLVKSVGVTVGDDDGKL